MHATTHYGQFDLSKPTDQAHIAERFSRLMCQLNHPSMAGRTLDLSDYLKDFVGPESPAPISRLSS